MPEAKRDGRYGLAQLFWDGRGESCGADANWNSILAGIKAGDERDPS